MALNPTRSNVPHICYYCPRVPKFHSVSLYNHTFSRYRPFWDKCTKWPQWSWTPQGQMYPIYVLLVSMSPQISLSFILWPAIFEIQAILRQCTKWPQNQSEYYKVKDTMYVLLVSASSKFHSISLYTQTFSRYRTFYSSTLTTMLNGQKRTRSKKAVSILRWPQTFFFPSQLLECTNYHINYAGSS